MSKPAVVLINPRSWSRRSMRLPLSLWSLAAVLEGRADYAIVDANAEDDVISATLQAIAAFGDRCVLAGLTVMPGPQVAPAIAISAAVRDAHPRLPIVWGGYFPTLYADAAINAPYVDALVRGQGEETLLELLAAIDGGGLQASGLRAIRGLTWKDGPAVIHNPERPFRPPEQFPMVPYGRVPNRMQHYLGRSFMGTRTAVHQVAIGCRYHCTFCGVASMFNGKTHLSRPERTAEVLRTLRDEYGANAMTYFDHNFFDREESSVAMLDAMARTPLPYWCYARADALAQFSSATWELVRRSGLKMAYIGAEASTDEALREMRKGTRVEHTLEAARRCREHGVIPEFSFILGGPEEPEADIDRTFGFVKHLKTMNPECEVVLYLYSPTPQRDPASAQADLNSPRLPMLNSYGPNGPQMPTTPEEWTQPRWVNYVCHQDAPWLTDRVRQRVKDFARVLGCRFPTVQDVRTPGWGKSLLRFASAWRYATDRYHHPWELDLLQRAIPLKQPQNEGV
jgi:radical SAM superfamily enzyme YgiQ (UPF0313 family)